MALVNCEDCNRAISPRARSCPHCGAPRGGHGAKIAGALVVLAAIGVFVWMQYEDQIRNRLAEQETISTPAPEAEKKRPASAPKAPMKKSDGVQRAALGARALKKTMPNPEGTRLQSALVVEGSGAVCYEYETVNSFGGRTIGRAVLAADGKRFLTSEMEGFGRLWSQECERKKGVEVASGINWLGL